MFDHFVRLAFKGLSLETHQDIDDDKIKNIETLTEKMKEKYKNEI